MKISKKIFCLIIAMAMMLSLAGTSAIAWAEETLVTAEESEAVQAVEPAEESEAAQEAVPAEESEAAEAVEPAEENEAVEEAVPAEESEAAEFDAYLAETPLIQTVNALTGCDSAFVYIGGIQKGQQFFVDITYGGKTIGTTDGKITGNGWAEVYLTEKLKENTYYTAQLYQMTSGSKSVKVYELKFDVSAAALMEHVESQVGNDYFDVSVSGVADGHTYNLTVEKNGTEIGYNDGTFSADGMVRVYLSSGYVLEKDVIYTVKLNVYIPGSGSKTREAGSLEFDPAGALIQKTDAVAGCESAFVYIEGISEGTEYFVNISCNGEGIGTTNGKITKNGWAEVILQEKLYANTDYKAELYKMTTGSQSEKVYELTFDAAAAAVMEHVESQVGEESFSVQVSNIQGGHKYYFTVVDTDGSTIGAGGPLDTDGKATVTLYTEKLKSDTIYTVKMSVLIPGDDKDTREVAALKFDPAGAIIQKTDAVAGCKSAFVYVDGIKESEEYFVNILKDGEEIGTTDGKITEYGWSEVVLTEELEAEAEYTAELYKMTTGSQSEKVYELKFGAEPSALMEHVESQAGNKYFDVSVSGVANGHTYNLTVEKNGTEIGYSEGTFSNDGMIRVYLSSGYILEKDVLYTVKLNVYIPDSGSKTREAASLEFDPAGAIVQKVMAMAGNGSAFVYVGGIKEGESYFVNITKDGEDLGTTDGKITENGWAEVYLGENLLEKDVEYTAELYKMITGSQSEKVYELLFDAEEVALMEHVEAYSGRDTAYIYVSGIDEDEEYFIDIVLDDETIGTTEKIVKDGKVMAYLSDSVFETGVFYEAQLYKMITGSMSVKVGSLTFNALEAVAYNIIEGQNGVWYKGSSSALVFRSDADFDKFIGVKVDDEFINEDNYDAWSGSTYVSLKASYLSTLKQGTHTLEIVSEDGSAKTQFTVTASVPKTGDSSSAMIFMLLGMMALAAICAGYALARRSERR